MKSLSGVGLGLSLVFGCLLLALVAELYYLLWWKKRVMRSSNHVTNNSEECTDHQIPAETPQFCYMFWCCRNPTSSSTPQQLCSSPTTLVHQPQSNKDLWLKPFASQDHQDCNFPPGLPRFLFTITEETREDLESEVGMSRRRNLSDLLQVLETPFLTPLASSPAASHHDHYFTPPLTHHYFIIIAKVVVQN
ncbi:UNVERIFIED_CONTAM: hypothetical protein Slati_1010300 [Sesamum latifolium]|uniref:Uncharacterized protein n=1 Tax=Sesamum latifolium TaxID=2727402 RepID=A0AAW2XSG8_9LAMI